MQSLKQEIEAIQKAHLYRSLSPIESETDAVIVVDGKSFANFSSNNYLGLANDPRLKEAAIAAVQQFGTGSGASRLVTGSLKIHHQLEEKLAHFKGTDSALLFNSGYHANLGILTAMLREGDEVYSDELNHASIVDGCRLSRAVVKVYRHRDVEHLESLLKSSPSIEEEKRRLIVTDSIFSMDGDAAPLKDLAWLAERYGAWLMVDEAHATGILGPNGKGLVEEIWPQEERPAYLQEYLIQMGTLGKALGSFGAYVAGNKDLIELLINKSRLFIYTTALPPSVAAASLAALEIVGREPERRQQLWKNVDYFMSELPPFLRVEEGRCKSPIFPIFIGDPKKTLEQSRHLREAGFWVTAIRYPTVPRGTERLRVTLMATHTTEQIKSFLENMVK